MQQQRQRKRRLQPSKHSINNADFKTYFFNKMALKWKKIDSAYLLDLIPKIHFDEKYIAFVCFDLASCD